MRSGVRERLAGRLIDAIGADAVRTEPEDLAVY